MDIKIKHIDYHRNGVSGIGFDVVVFDWKEGGVTRQMVATLFPGAGRCAVLDTELVGEGNVRFGVNSWRGDSFEDDLRKAIADHKTARDAKFAKEVSR